MQRILILGLVTVALALPACGNDDSNKHEKTVGTGTGTGSPAAQTPVIVAPGTLAIFEDDEIASSSIAALVDEGTAGAAEENDDGGTGQALTDMGKTVDINRFRDCTEDGDKAVVAIKRSAALTNTIDRPGFKTQISFTSYDDRQRTWAKTGGAVKCAAGKKHAALKFADMQGVSLDATSKRSRASELIIENKKKGTSVTRGVKTTAEGTRHIDWSATTVAGATTTLEKTVTSSMKRTLEAKNKKGETKSLAATVATKDGAPLSIAVERDTATGDAVSRTIKSGTLVATNADGTRVETTFTNVKYTKEGGCLAASGKIAGTVFAKDAAEAAATWAIDFDTEAKDLVTSDGKELDFSPDGCDLDEAAENQTDKDTGADIKDPTK